MAARRNQEQTETTNPKVLKVGRVHNFPVIAAEVEIKSLPGFTSKEQKKAAEEFLKDGDGWKFTDVRYLPAGWGSVEEIADREGLHRAIDRIYDGFVALQAHDQVELPAVDEDGNLIPDGEGERHDIKFSVEDRDGNWVEQPVAGGLANVPENCDRVAWAILEYFQYGAKLLAVQKNLRLVKLAEAEAAAKAEGLYKDVTGGTKKERARKVI